MSIKKNYNIYEMLSILSKLEFANYNQLIVAYNKIIIELLEMAHGKNITLLVCPPVSQDVIYLNDKFVGYVGDFITDLYDEDIKFSQLVSIEYIELFSAICKFKVLVEADEWLISIGFPEPMEDAINSAFTNILTEYKKLSNK